VGYSTEKTSKADSKNGIRYNIFIFQVFT